MPNIASVLKEEISRVARKELRACTDSLKKAVSGQRRQLAELRRRIQLLERQANRTSKASHKALSTEQDKEEPVLRFRPDGLKKHRERLGLSANDVAKILGCSQLSVYKWESGKTRPRTKQLEAIAQLRSMGKREALKRLEELRAE